jgi:N6-L-threonylcarbamoyladenine synthase
MKVLSIETSCDDTGIALFKATGGVDGASFEVLANEVSSQIDIHKEYGGVFPALAKREHIKNLPIVLNKILKKHKLENSKKPFDLIVVTSGPGLEPALWTGIVFAKELSLKYKIPVMPVNHMEGHILSVFAKEKGKFKLPKTGNKKDQLAFPLLSLLVSGGHTELVLSKSWMDYKIIGQTLDDAVGEAFDKTARMLGLPYPGGPEISKLAEQGRKSVLKSLGRSDKDAEKNISLPRPMMYSKNFDFSFSGLKTAVLYLIKKIGKLDEETKIQIALEFENAAIDVLVHKTKKAIEKYNTQTLLVGGGVSANKHLRNTINKEIKNNKILFPEKKLSTDNALMTGIVGYLRFIERGKKGIALHKIKAQGNLDL